jgi:hypothetical protein
MCKTTRKGMRFNPSIRTSLQGLCTHFCGNNASLSWSWSLSFVDPTQDDVEHPLEIDDWAVGLGTDEVALSRFLYSNYSYVDEFRVSLEVTTDVSMPSYCSSRSESYAL